MSYSLEISEGRAREVIDTFKGETGAGDARDKFYHARGALLAGQCLSLIQTRENGSRVTLETVRPN